MVAWIGCYLQQADKLSTSSRDQAGVFHPNILFITSIERQITCSLVIQNLVIIITITPPLSSLVLSIYYFKSL
jgi:hypothetical protein